MEATVEQINRLVTPCRAQKKPLTLGEYLGKETTKKDKYDIYITRGERHLPNVSKDEIVNNDQLIATGFSYLHEKAQREDIRSEYPELAPIFDQLSKFEASVTRQDVHTQCANKTPLMTAAYVLDDLSFNLSPDRHVLVLNQLRHPESATDALKLVLEKLSQPCRYDQGCYFRLFFDHVGRPGPVAVSEWVQKIIVDELYLNAYDEEEQEALIEVLHSLLCEEERNLESTFGTSHKVCIVCLLLHQAGHQWSENDRVTLLNADKSLGLMTTYEDSTSDNIFIQSVHPRIRMQLHDYNKIGEIYAVVNKEGFWLAEKKTKSSIQIK